MNYIDSEFIRHNPDAIASSIIELICEDLKFRDMQNELNAIFHPISTTISTIRQHRADIRQNVRSSMQRELLGDSEINHYTNRGV